MNSTLKTILWIGGGLAVAGGIALTASQLQAIDQQIKGFFKNARLTGYGGSQLKAQMDVTLVNNSAFDIPLSNFYITLRYMDASGQWQDLLTASQSIPVVTLKKFQSRNVDKMPLVFPVTNISTVLDILANKTNRLQVQATFMLKGYQKTISEEIDASGFISSAGKLLRDVLGNLGINLLGVQQNNFLV